MRDQDDILQDDADNVLYLQMPPSERSHCSRIWRIIVSAFDMSKCCDLQGDLD